MLHVKCFFLFFPFFIYFISGPVVIGFLAVAMTLPNVYILSVTFSFFSLFLFHNGKANFKKNRVGFIADFGHRKGKGFGKPIPPPHPTPLPSSDP